MSGLPDKEAHMSEVQQLAETVREGISPSAKPEPLSGVVSPIHLAPAHEGIPFEYILHVHMQECKSCGCVEQFSEFFAHFAFKSRMGGSQVKHLRRTERPLFNLPVRRLEIKDKPVPFCSDCPDFNLSTLPPPPSEAKLTDAPEALLRSGKKLYGEPEKKAKAPAKPSMKSNSLDDLI